MGNEQEKKIKVIANGPYEISGHIPVNQLRFVPDAQGNSLDYQKIDSYLDQEKCYLCRCGHSHEKPFCDGNHDHIHFEGKEAASHQTYDEMAKTIQGHVMDLMDAEELCAVARFCDTHGSTWQLIEQGTTEQEKEIIKEQCVHCPSGRLTAVTKEGERIEPLLEKEISVLEDTAAMVHGPLWVKGGIEIEDAEGEPYPVRNRVTLCRCGKSYNKPFCDGNHMR